MAIIAILKQQTERIITMASYNDNGPTYKDTCTIDVCKVIRKTEKAVFIDVTIDTAIGRKGAKIWIPLSQLKVDEVAEGSLEIPVWLHNAKLEDWREWKGLGQHWDGSIYRII